MFLLSVIIPVYNMEAYLEKCLCSILASVGEDNMNDVEILLVDDGSTDNSGSICVKYAEQIQNIQLFSKKNGGIASARNLGLDNTRGKYIAWVDPDDYVSPEWFDCIRNTIFHNEPDVIVMDSVRFGSEGEKPEIYGRPSGFVDRDLFFEDVIRDIRMLSGLPNKVMKAELFKNVRFDPSLPILEDFAALPWILESARSVYYIPKCLYYYRQHRNSLLHNDSFRPFLAVEVALRRETAVRKLCHRAAVTATAMHAFVFCRSCYLISGFAGSEDQQKFCQRYIRKNIVSLITDKEIRWTMRLKLVLLGWGLYKFVACLKHR